MGVLSRGEDCAAEANSAAVATRVKAHLDWIGDVTGIRTMGKCALSLMKCKVRDARFQIRLGEESKRRGA